MPLYQPTPSEHSYAPVYRRKEKVFEIVDLGISTWRAETFETKEPETLAWIESIGSNSRLLDVGANIGLYSLYAACIGVHVIALEPHCMNYALLSSNIHKNAKRLRADICAYPIAASSKFKLDLLHLDSLNYGTAQASFGNHLDEFGQIKQRNTFSQGSIGMSVDEIVMETGFLPNHIKVDVDGNEFEVLLGSQRLLQLGSTRSVLIELSHFNQSYIQSVALLEKSGFVLSKRIHMTNEISNYLFTRD